MDLDCTVIVINTASFCFLYNYILTLTPQERIFIDILCNLLVNVPNTIIY